MNKLSILTIIFAAAMLFAFANVNTVAAAQDFNILVNNQECLDLENASQKDNVRLTIAPCDDASSTQRFEIVGKAGTGFVNFKIGSNRCIEITNAQTGDGVDATQFGCDNSSEQAFRLQNGTIPRAGGLPITGTISFSHSGKCFDFRNSPWVQQFACDGSANQVFQIKDAPKLSPNSQFLIKWDAEASKKIGVKIGQIELTEVTSYCQNGCDCLEPDENKATIFLTGWTPNLTAGAQRDAQALAVKPTIVADYCISGAAQKGLNLEVQIWDKNMNNAFGNAFAYTITPNDCAKTTTTTANSSEDQLWDSISASTNRLDFQNYLNLYGQNGKYAPLARLKVSNLPVVAATPTTTTGVLSVEDQFWNSVKNSTNAKDFQAYLNNYPMGKYAPLARLEINRKSTANPTNPITPTGTGTVEDQYWDSVKNSRNANDFQGYLNNYPNGKYAALARLKINQNPTAQTLDDQQWDRIKNSRNLNDFQGYLRSFPNGNHAVQAKLVKGQIETEQETAAFLRNASFGSLGEISGKRKVFITATNFDSRNRIVQELQKKASSLIIVANKQDADFFIEYKLNIAQSCDPGPSTAVNACELHTGTLWVHTIVDQNTGRDFNRILWKTTKTKSYSDAGINLFDKNPAAQAGGDLAKELRNLGF